MEKISQSELIAAVALEAGYPKSEVDRILKSAAETIKCYAKDGQAVSFMGIGKFVPHDAPERMGRNPKTGDEFKIPAKRVLRFKVSSTVDLTK